jgi:hypothetical protein
MRYGLNRSVGEHAVYGFRGNQGNIAGQDGKRISQHLGGRGQPGQIA